MKDTTTTHSSLPPLLYGEKPSLPWLQQNAVCVDSKSTIYADVSTVLGAGHGAFASRNFAANERILMVPLLPIPEASILDFFYQDHKNKKDRRGSKNRLQHKQKQLLYNYCYGHSESEMLLFPVAPGVNLINHQASTKDQGVGTDLGANVKLQWLSYDGSDSDEKSNLMKNQHILETMDPYDILLDFYAPRGDDPPVYMGFPGVGGLVMEIVATKDISKGDEIFLDYGSEWETAWLAYLEKQKDRSAMDEEQRRAVHWNHEYISRPFPTEDDEEASRAGALFWDSSNVMLKAFVPLHDDVSIEDSDRTVRNILAKKEEDAPLGSAWTYTIEIVNPEYGGDDEDIPEFLVVDEVPHNRFFFVDVARTSYLYAFDPFRHVIGIPDEMFPANKKWRNKKNAQ